MKRWSLWLVLFALLGEFTPVFGAGLIIIDDAHWWPGPPRHPIPPLHPIPPWPRPTPPRRPYIFAPLEVHDVKVKTRITDQLAVTSIEQEFYNPNASRLEGTFLFPLP